MSSARFHALTERLSALIARELSEGDPEAAAVMMRMFAALYVARFV